MAGRSALKRLRRKLLDTSLFVGARLGLSTLALPSQSINTRAGGISRRQLFLVLLLVHVCLPLAFRRLKFSIYYAPDVAEMKRIEAERRERAEAFFEAPHEKVLNRHRNKDTFCIAITSDKREISYLLPTAFSVLRSLDDGMDLVVYNTQRPEEPPNPVQNDLERLRAYGKVSLFILGNT